MSQFDSSSSPPSNSEFGIEVEQPAWPKVVGIISIVWACINLLCNACQLTSSALQGMFLGMVPPEQQEQMKQQMASQNRPLTVVISLLGIAIAALLIMAGVQTIRRRASGRLLHILWGAIAMLLVVVGGAMGWQQMKVQLAQAMQRDPNAAKAPGAVTGVAYGIFGCIMIVIIIWPLFCLMWFGIMGKRPEVGSMPEEPLV